MSLTTSLISGSPVSGYVSPFKDLETPPQATDAASQQNAPAQGTAANTPAAPPDGTPVTRSSSLPPDSAIPAGIALQLKAGVAPGGAATGAGAAQPADGVQPATPLPKPSPMTGNRAVEVLYNNFDKFDVAKDRSEGKNNTKGDGKVGKKDLEAVSKEGANGPHKYGRDMVNAANYLIAHPDLVNRMSTQDHFWNDYAMTRELVDHKRGCADNDCIKQG